jgi:hypothetical protein
MACRESSAGASVETQFGLEGQGESIRRVIQAALYAAEESPATRFPRPAQHLVG